MTLCCTKSHFCSVLSSTHVTQDVSGVNTSCGIDETTGQLTPQQHIPQQLTPQQHTLQQVHQEVDKVRSTCTCTYTHVHAIYILYTYMYMSLYLHVHVRIYVYLLKKKLNFQPHM